MCGICGIIHFDESPVRESVLQQMMKAMKHRGPDDEGVYFDKNVGLGFVRLSIIDLSSTGHQPMFSSDGRYVIVFNGEIYNYIELREELKKKGVVFKSNSDTEVLLKAYIFWGIESLDKFNGMWSFAIYDRVKKSLFAARDRYGIKPFYYHFDGKSFHFASEIQPILSVLEKKPHPDMQSIFDYLVFNRTDYNENTFFLEIKKMQHGHFLQFDTSGLKSFQNQFIKRWYSLKEKIALAEPFQSPEELYSIFSNAVELRLRSDVPVGVCLSGGVDSSSIVSVLHKEFQKKDINTFSAIYGEGKIGDESAFINLYKNDPGIRYFTTPSLFSLLNDFDAFVECQGEPVPSTSIYAQFKVMELASKHVKVTLDGQGADEELAGYHYFFGFYFKELLQGRRLGTLANEIYYYFKNHNSIYGIKSFLFFLLPENWRTTSRVAEKQYLEPHFSNSFSKTNSISRNIYNSSNLHDALLDHFEYKLEHLLKWEDRNSMWFSIEARVPFLDYRLVERILASPSDKVIKNGTTKHILREAMKGILPEQIRLRKDKMGFETPQAEWFRTFIWQEKINAVLKSNSFRDRGIIKVKNAIQFYQDHFNGKKDLSKEIWKWIHLEQWFRMFID